MDDEARQAIKENRLHLEKSIDYDKLRRYLKECKMFNRYMWEDIHSTSDMLGLLSTRGPKALCDFIKILRKAGYDTEADVLEKATNLCLVSSDKLYYNMSSNPLGCCLIINNMKFDNPLKFSYREGSDVDAKSLEEFFKKAEFEVDVVSNLTAAQMNKCILDFSKKDKFKAKTVDSMFLIIMSHGSLEKNREVIYGKDGKTIYKDEIYNFFSNKNCEHLNGKPKVFFFIACRGENMDHGTPKRQESLDYVLGDDELSDILLINSSPPKCVTPRHHVKGTYFCQALVSVLKEYYEKYDLETMIKFINQKLVGTVSEDYRIPLGAHAQNTTWQKRIMLCRKQ